MTFSQAAERFTFAAGISAHQAIRIVESYVSLPENVDDMHSSYIVRPVGPDAPECDSCGGYATRFTVEQRHPEGQSLMCAACWLQENGR